MALHDEQQRRSNGEENGAALATANGHVSVNGAHGAAPLTRRDMGNFSLPNGGRYGDYDSAEGFDVKRLAQIFMRRRRVVIVVFIAVFASVVAWTLRAKPVYRSTAQIRIINNQDNVADTITGAASLMPSSLISRTLDTEIQLIDTDELKDHALQKLPPEMQDELNKYALVDVNDVRDTDLIGVSVSSHRKVASAAYANAICDTYVEQSQAKNRAQMQKASDYVAQQIAKVEADLDTARAALEKFKRKAGVTAFDEQLRLKTDQLGQMESDLKNTQADRASAESRLSVLRASLRGMSRELRSSTTLGDSPAAEAIKEQLAKLEVDRVSAMKEFAPDAPEIRNINDNINELKRRLTQETRSVARQQTINVNPVWQTTVQNIADLQGQISGFSAREGALQDGIGKLQANLVQLPATERELATLMAKVQSGETARASFVEKKQSIDVQVIAQGANGEKVVTATEPQFAVSPNVKRNIVLGFILGIMLSTGLAVLIDVLDDRVHSDEDVRSASGLPVLTHVPDIKEIAHQTLLGLPNNNRTSAETALARANHYTTTPLLESFRMLRANIMFSASVDDQIRTIVVTSSRPAEGKSSSALNLAIALAMDGKNVILADCDLRRPKVHDLLGIRNHFGFTSVVTGQLPLHEALQKTPVTNLRVLTGGPVPPNPTELLNSRAGRACLQQLAREVDFLILDTPPALMMADAQVVASQADAVLLVVSANEADKREVARTTELMAQTGARLLGTVLNKSDITTGGYYNYNSYSQYYSRPDDDASNNGDGSENSKHSISNVVKGVVES